MHPRSSPVIKSVIIFIDQNFSSWIYWLLIGFCLFAGEWFALLLRVLGRAEIDGFDRLVAFTVLRCRNAHLMTILEIAMEKLKLARWRVFAFSLRLDVLLTVSFFNFQFTCASDLKSGFIVRVLLRLWFTSRSSLIEIPSDNASEQLTRVSLILSNVLAGLFLELVELREARVFVWRGWHVLNIRRRLDLHRVLLFFPSRSILCRFRPRRLLLLLNLQYWLLNRLRTDESERVRHFGHLRLAYFLVLCLGHLLIVITAFLWRSA